MDKKKERQQAPELEYHIEEHIQKEESYIRALEIQLLDAKLHLARLLEKNEDNRNHRVAHKK